jgi:hypothetical protein
LYAIRFILSNHMGDIDLSCRSQRRASGLIARVYLASRGGTATSTSFLTDARAGHNLPSA